MRVGFFGGSFDPIHIGHLILGQETAWQLGLDRLLFVPTAHPPHKRDRVLTPVHHRLTMAELAIEGVPSFEVSSREAGSDPSYTVDTLRWASSAFPGAELFLLIGGDSLAELDTWRAPEEIRSRATLAVYEREGYAPSPPETPCVRIAGPLVPISSTAVRARVREGRPIRFWVPRAVAAYIEAEGLYAGVSS